VSFRICLLNLLKKGGDGLDENHRIVPMISVESSWQSDSQTGMSLGYFYVFKLINKDNVLMTIETKNTQEIPGMIRTLSEVARQIHWSI